MDELTLTKGPDRGWPRAVGLLAALLIGAGLASGGLGVALAADASTASHKHGSATGSLQLSVSGHGTVYYSSSKSCAHRCHLKGKLITLYPQPKAGWEFAGWRGACASKGAVKCVLRKPRGKTTAFFRRPLTVELQILGYGTVQPGNLTSNQTTNDCKKPCKFSVPYGQPLLLGAAPPPGSKKRPHWTGCLIKSASGLLCLASPLVGRKLMVSFGSKAGAAPVRLRASSRLVAAASGGKGVFRVVADSPDNNHADIVQSRPISWDLAENLGHFSDSGRQLQPRDFITTTGDPHSFDGQGQGMIVGGQVSDYGDNSGFKRPSDIPEGELLNCHPRCTGKVIVVHEDLFEALPYTGLDFDSVAGRQALPEVFAPSKSMLWRWDSPSCRGLEHLCFFPDPAIVPLPPPTGYHLTDGYFNGQPSYDTWKIIKSDIHLHADFVKRPHVTVTVKGNGRVREPNYDGISVLSTPFSNPHSAYENPQRKITTDPSINCSTGDQGVCDRRFLDTKDEAVMTATPEAGSTFAGWDGCTKPKGNVCIEDSGATQDKPPKDAHVTAIFTEPVCPVFHGRTVRTASACKCPVTLKEHQICFTFDGKVSEHESGGDLGYSSASTAKVHMVWLYDYPTVNTMEDRSHETASGHVDIVWSNPNQYTPADCHAALGLQPQSRYGSVFSLAQRQGAQLQMHLQIPFFYYVVDGTCPGKPGSEDPNGYDPYTYTFASANYAGPQPQVDFMFSPAAGKTRSQDYNGMVTMIDGFSHPVGSATWSGRLTGDAGPGKYS